MKTVSFEALDDGIKVLSAKDFPLTQTWLEIKSMQELMESIKQKHIISSVFATQCFLFLSKTNPDEFLPQISSLKKYYPISTYAQTLLTRLEMVSNNKEVCLGLIEEMLKEEQTAVENCAQNINSLIYPSERILLHSHSGSFENIFGGRILEALKLSQAENKGVHVFLVNSVPHDYALKLMATELKDNNITFTLATDTSAATLIRKSKVQKVFTAAKRMAANGDTVIDAGGYSLALFCDHHSINFYSCVMHSMMSKEIPTGDSFSIQFTEPEQFTSKDIFDSLSSPRIYSPEVDVVPAKLITGWVMEDGLVSGTF